MKRIVFQLFFYLLLATMAGCSASSNHTVTTQKTEAPETGVGWHASLVVSGGMAGFNRQLSIDANGELVARDLKTGKTVESKLQNKQLEQLEQLFTALEGVSAPRSGPTFPGRCADCIETRLKAMANNKPYSITVRSGDKQPKPYADLIGYLANLLQQALSQ